MNTPDENLNERLSAYLDGELSPDESAALERTLAVDPALRLELEELAEVKRMVGHLPRHAAPASMKLAIHDQLERRSLLHQAGSAAHARRPGFRFLRILSMAAAVVLGCAVSITVWQQLHPPQQDGAADLTMKQLAEGNHLGDGSAAAPSEYKLSTAGAPAGTPVASAELDRAKSAEGWKDADLPKSGDRGAHKAGLEDAATGSTGGGAGRSSPGPGRPEARSGKVGPAVEAEGGELRGAVDGAEKGENPSLAERFDKGPVTAGDVAKGRFNEAVQIDVPVTDAKQQEKVIADARQTLVSNGGVDISELAANTRLTDKDHQFVYEGQANRNFASNGNQSQIVLRGNREVIGKVADQVQKDANGQAQFNVQSSRLRGAKREAVEQVRRQSFANLNTDNSGNGNVNAGQPGNDTAMAKPSGPSGSGASGAAAGPGHAPEHPAGKVITTPGTAGKIDAGVAAVPPAPTVVAVAPRPSPPTPIEPLATSPASQPAQADLHGKGAENPRDAKVSADGVVTADGHAAGSGRNATYDLTAPTSRPDGAPTVASAQPLGGDGRNLSQPAAVANAPGQIAPQAGQRPKDMAHNEKPAGGRGNDMLDVVINVYVPAEGQQGQGQQGRQGQFQQLNLRPQQTAPNSQIRPLAEASTQAEQPASVPAGH